MKFISLFIGAVSASSLARRDLATIQGVLTGVSSQVDSLNAAVTAFSGDPAPLTAASNSLLSAINAGVTTVQGTSALSENDALTLAGSVTALNSSVAAVVDNLISKTATFQAAGQVPTLLDQLTQQKAGSTALANAITSKVPESLAALAAQLSGDIAANLQRAIDAYSGLAPPPGSSTAAPPPPSSTAAPPPPGSSAPPPPGSSTPASTPPSYPTSAPSPPSYPSDSYGLTPPSSSTKPAPPPSYPSSPSSPSSKPAPPPSYPSSPSSPSSKPAPPPSYPDTPSYPTSAKPTKKPSYTQAPPAVQTGAAVVNQIGASLAVVAGLAALFI